MKPLLATALERPSDPSPQEGSSSTSLGRKLRAQLTTPTIIMGISCLTYLVLFVNSISSVWFNPRWTTDDGVQQLFPFYEAIAPEVFKGDFIAEVMRGYLAPLHWGLGYSITLLTQDPIMTGHYMMLLQLLIAGAFLFLAARRVAGLPVAFFALLWLFHTRTVIQRMTAGLPRGWAVPLFLGYLYFALGRQHRAVLALIFAGCLLNPPAAFLIAASYGLLISLKLINPQTRHVWLRPFILLLICSPIFIVTTLWVTKRPPSVGSVVTLSDAVDMPEFSRKGGRFSYLPFPSVSRELENYGIRAFVGKVNRAPAPLHDSIGFIILAIVAALLTAGVMRRREIIPVEIVSFGAAAIIVYLASRPLAFHLYVPDRHINIPLALFLILGLSIGIWRALDLSKLQSALPKITSLRETWLSLLGLASLASLIYFCNGLNLRGDLNFNYNNTKRGYFPTWLRDSTPKTSLIAGHPTLIDPVPLFSMRKVYATSETWHPFYSQYNETIKSRLALELRAHYASSLQEFLDLVTPAGIDYFVFERRRFYTEELKKNSYYAPLNELARELGSRPPEQYAYRQLPLEVDMNRYPFMPYRDSKVAIIDVRALREYLRGT